MFPVLQTLINDAEKILDAIRAHLGELGHEAEADATALLEQAKAAAGPVVQAAEADAEQLATEAVGDVAAAIPTTGTMTPDPAETAAS